MHPGKLHGDPTLGHAIVVVNVTARDDRSPAVHEILGQLGLGFDSALPPSGPVDGDAVVALPGGPGGLFAAFDKKDGKPLWRSKAVPDAVSQFSVKTAP